MIEDKGNVIMTKEEYEKYQYSFGILQQEVEDQKKDILQYRKDLQQERDNYNFHLKEVIKMQESVIELKNIIKGITKNFF